VAPDAVNVKLCPRHTEVFEATAVTVGKGFTTTFTEAELGQVKFPVLVNAATEYTVLTVGVTTTPAKGEPLLQV
jgi:cell division GTPase FtsZ